MPRIAMSKTRIQSGDEVSSGKDMQTGAMSNGGPVSNPRAQKPVKGSSNSYTSKVSDSPKTTRPSTGVK